jgi:hypothetical protein
VIINEGHKKTMIATSFVALRFVSLESIGRQPRIMLLITNENHQEHDHLFICGVKYYFTQI